MAVDRRTTVVRVIGNPGQVPGDGFARWLRRRSDTELVALLAARPDLMTPVPADLGALATRACRRLSLERALDDLDQFTLRVAGTLPALEPPVTASRLADALAVPPAALGRSLAALRARALAWQAEACWQPAPGLHALTREPLWPAAADGVSPEPPPLDAIPDGFRGADQAAAAVLAVLRCTEDLLARWAAQPPPVLRSGGLGIRDLRKAAAYLDTDLAAAALFTEIARASGLLAASSWTSGEWLPSHSFDIWRDAAPARRWATLAWAWLTTTRVPGLVGTRDDRGRLVAALGAGLDRMDAPVTRARVLQELASAQPGASVAADALLRRLSWRWPRWLGPQQVKLAEMALREAAVLGLTSRGVLAAHGRALVSGDPDEAAEVLATILPEPVGHMVLQADLTAVAPGPLVPALARELALTADVESTGGAVVYRFSAASVRRAFDAGRGAAQLLATLTEYSRTPVPQPLRYLIEDVERRHGRIRVGAACAYIRCDDPAALAEIAADRRAAPLRLRALAPTVLTSPLRRGDVLALLRRLGHAPAAESADGTVEITSPAARRAPGRPAGYGAPPGATYPRAADPPWPARERAAAAVRSLRAGHE